MGTKEEQIISELNCRGIKWIVKDCRILPYGYLYVWFTNGLDLAIPGIKPDYEAYKIANLAAARIRDKIAHEEKIDKERAAAYAAAR